MKISVRTKYEIHTTQKYRKQLRKICRQGKDVDKLIMVIEALANKQKLDVNYRDHALINNKNYKDCRECHIEPDWLLVYKYYDAELVLLMIETGSHSELFK